MSEESETTEEQPDVDATTIDLSALTRLDDEQLFEAWEQECGEGAPTKALVAALEVEARRRGFDMSMVASGVEVILAANVSSFESLHPRGLDGKWIEKLGLVDIVNFKTKGIGGKEETINKQRGTVQAITPDPKDPKNPNIRVVFNDPKTGKPSQSFTVKPGNIRAAPKQLAHLGPDGGGDHEPPKVNAPGGSSKGGVKPGSMEETVDRVIKDTNELSVDDALTHADDVGGEEGTLLLTSRATRSMNDLADEILAAKDLDPNSPEMADHQAAIKTHQDDINRLLTAARDANGGEDTGPPIDWNALTKAQAESMGLPSPDEPGAIDWSKEPKGLGEGATDFNPNTGEVTPLDEAPAVPEAPVAPKSEWGPEESYQERAEKLAAAGGEYNGNLKLYEMPDGSTIRVDTDPYKKQVRYSVRPPGVSMWSTDQSKVQRHGNLDDALASIGGGPEAPGGGDGGQAAPAFLTPDDLDTVPAPPGLDQPNVGNDMVMIDNEPYTVVPFNGGERYQLQPFNRSGDSLWLDEQQANNVQKIDFGAGGEAPTGGGGDADAMAKKLRDTGVFDDWYGREKDLSEGKLWLAPDKFNERVDKGQFGDVPDDQREPLRQALMKNAGEIDAANEKQYSEQKQALLDKYRAKAVPFDKAKKNSIVMVNENGNEVPVRVSSKSGGRLYGTTLDGSNTYYDDGIMPNEVVDPNATGTPAAPVAEKLGQPGDTVQFDLEGRKVQGIVDGKGNVVFKPTASERESMGLGSQAAIPFTSLEQDGKVLQVNKKPYKAGGSGGGGGGGGGAELPPGAPSEAALSGFDNNQLGKMYSDSIARPDTPAELEFRQGLEAEMTRRGGAGGGGESTAAKRAASGATVEGGEVVGDDAGFPGSSVKLLDGSDSQVGTRVKYAKDGKLGEIVGYDKSDNYVKVKFDDGTTAIRSKRTLKADDGSDGGGGGGEAPATPTAPAAPAAPTPEKVSAGPEGSPKLTPPKPGSVAKQTEPPEVNKARDDFEKATNDLVKVEKDLNGFSPNAVQSNTLGPAAQNRYNSLQKQRSALYAARDKARQVIRDQSLEPEDVRTRLDDALRESGNEHYKADDPTITQLIKDALKNAQPDDERIWIKPPSGSEMGVPIADAQVIAGI